MKHLPLYIAFSCMCCSSFGQKDSLKIVHGVDVSGNSLMSKYNGLLGIMGRVNYNLSIGRHTLGIGPVLEYNNFTYYDGPYDRGWSPDGAQFYYQFSPNPWNRVVNFYFRYDLLWEYASYPNKNQGFDGDFTEHGLHNVAGYGFRAKIFRGLYIDQGISFGWSYIHYRFRDSKPEYNETGQFNVPSFLLRVGMGYQFHKNN